MSAGSTPGMGRRAGVVGAFTRGLAVFRPLALAYAVLLAWLNREDMDRPLAAVAVFVVLGVWTLVAGWRRRITTRMAVIDLTLASLGILATSLAYPRETVMDGALTLPGIWAAAGVVAAAIRWGARGGIAGATVIALADLVSVITPNFGTVHNIVLLYLVGALIGLATTLAHDAERLLEASVRAEEAYAERERLARIVHDGVLQALAFIHRRGTELGGPSVQLGELAAEQERTLRALVSGRAAPAPEAGGEGPVDLAAQARTRAGARITVSAPAEPVEVPADRGTELLAAMDSALDNVRKHAGPDARAWVLVEDLGPEVAITVRDDGLGMAPGREAEAAAQGRLGLSGSIRGRLSQLGGTVSVTSAAGKGAAVTLTAPKVLEPLARPARERAPGARP